MLNECQRCATPSTSEKSLAPHETRHVSSGLTIQTRGDGGVDEAADLSERALRPGTHDVPPPDPSPAPVVTDRIGRDIFKRWEPMKRFPDADPETRQRVGSRGELDGNDDPIKSPICCIFGCLSRDSGLNEQKNGSNSPDTKKMQNTCSDAL